MNICWTGTTKKTLQLGLPLLCVSLLSRSAAATQIDPFFAFPSLGSIADPSDCVPADFDLDGYVDLVIVSRYGEGRLFLNDGHGSLHLRTIFPASPRAFFVLAADTDGDGDLDILTAGTPPTGGVFVNKNMGDGVFEDGVQLPTPLSPQTVQATDWDGDGDIDLAVTHLGQSSSHLTVLLMGDDGQYEPFIQIPDVGRGAVLVDVDSDGDEDILASKGGPNRLVLRLNNGDGTIGPESVQAASFIPAGSHSVDLNQDKIPDVVFGPTSTSFTVALSSGADYSRIQTTETDGSSTGLTSFDADGDGDLDLALAVQVPGSVAIYNNDGLGGFTAAQSTPGHSYPIAIKSADFTGDGLVDIVTLSDLQSNAAIWIATADEGYETNESQPIPFGVIGSLFADVTGDAVKDLLIWSDQVRHAHLLPGLPEGGFDQPREMQELGSWVRFALATDLNQDGLTDLATSTRAGGVFVAVSDGAGDYTTPPGGPYDGDYEIRHFASADIDGDGDTDLVTADRVGKLILLMNEGDGQFLASPTLRVGVAPLGLEIEDIDRDGHSDIVIAGSPDVVEIHWGDGVGGYAAPTCLFPGSGLSGLAVTDLDQDGNPDIVTLHGSRSVLSVMESQGSRTFGGIFNHPASSGGVLRATDLDVDGYPDLLYTIGSSFAVMRNQGDGTLAPPHFYLTKGATATYEIDDVDLNGYPDVISFSEEQSELTVHLNRRGATADCPADSDRNGLSDLADIVAFIAAFNDQQSPADLDNDGQLDLSDIVLFLEYFVQGCSDESE